MSFDVTTMMAGPDLATATADTSEVGEPTLRGAGATEVKGWQVLSGPWIGKFAVQTRWDSLDTFATGMREIAAKAASDESIAAVLGRWTPEFRVILSDIQEGGTCDGEYMMATRFSTTGPIAGATHAIGLARSGGANGARILQAIVAGEWTGQAVGASYYDSLDVVPGLLATNATDEQFRAYAAASGMQVLSRTLFQRI